jgi:hypothetical protein
MVIPAPRVFWGKESRIVLKRNDLNLSFDLCASRLPTQIVQHLAMGVLSGTR